MKGRKKGRKAGREKGRQKGKKNSFRKKYLKISYLTCVFCTGIITPNLFDQLQTASFMGGYNAVIRGAAPAISQYVTSGIEPFLAVYSAMEVCI